MAGAGTELRYRTWKTGLPAPFLTFPEDSKTRDSLSQLAHTSAACQLAPLLINPLCIGFIFFAAVSSRKLQSSACGTPVVLDDGSAALSCNLGDLQPSATVRVVLTFKPTAEGTFSPITGNLSANSDTVELNNTASTSIKVVSALMLCAAGGSWTRLGMALPKPQRSALLWLPMAVQQAPTAPYFPASIYSQPLSHG